MNLLIHGDPGARNGFVAAWVTKSLLKVSFDAGLELHPRFTKIHNFYNNEQVTLKNFPGLKIRIRPTFKMIDNHALLFLRKTVQTHYLGFSPSEYSLESFSKLWTCFKEYFEHDLALDYSMYDHVINFEDTYNLEVMTRLYQAIWSKQPSQQEIHMFNLTNQKNLIQLDPNHSASLIKLIFDQESLLQVNEQQRRWSIVEIYKNTTVDQLYERVKQTLVKENYNHVA